jgi:hypothetical protein
MPMMLVSDDDFLKEVEKLSDKKLAELSTNKDLGLSDETRASIVTSLDLFKKGRPQGRLEIPNSIRSLVAEEAICGASPDEISKSFGVSKSSISAYKNDATSTASYDTPNKELKEKNDEVREDISGRARSKLIMALDAITEEKIGAAKVRDIASIAQSMSGIVKNLEPAVPQHITNNNQVVVYRPKQNELEDFEVITVKE